MFGKIGQKYQDFTDSYLYLCVSLAQVAKYLMTKLIFSKLLREMTQISCEFGGYGDI
jgi:hypothetical protein